MTRVAFIVNLSLVNFLNSIRIRIASLQLLIFSFPLSGEGNKKPEPSHFFFFNGKTNIVI